MKYILILFTFLVFNVVAQTSEDEVNHKLTLITQLNDLRYIDSAEKILETIRQKDILNYDKETQFEYSFQLAYNLKLKRKKEARILIDSIKLHFDSVKYNTRIKYLEGYFFISEYNYVEALKLFLDLIKDQNLSPKYRHRVYQHIALCGLTQNNEALIYEFTQKAIHFDTTDNFAAYYILATHNYNNEKLDSAIYYSELALKNQSPSPRTAANFNILGFFYMQSGEYNKSLSILMSVHDFLKKIEKSYALKTQNSAYISILYDSLNNIKEQEYFLVEASDYAAKSGSKAFIRDSYVNLIDFYYQKRDVDRLHKSIHEYIKVRDQLNEDQKIKDFQKAIALYETEQKELKIQLLEKEKINQQERTKALFIILTGACFLLILAIIIAIYRIRFKNNILKSKEEKEELLQENISIQREKLTNLLDELKDKSLYIEQLKNEQNFDEKALETITSLINESNNSDEKWNKIILSFNALYPNFIKNLKDISPENITNNDIRIAILTKMNQSSKQMADVLSVSIHAVNKSRQRLNKKINHTTDNNLENIIHSL